jgi:YHS domain-containing protein
LGRSQIGSPTHAYTYQGATLRFTSAANLAAFKTDPERYAPQFGGYCAWAVSQHYLAPGDPNYWKIVDGKLYLNANARAKELWEADQADAIVRGHANWPKVLSDNQESK